MTVSCSSYPTSPAASKSSTSSTSSKSSNCPASSPHPASARRALDILLGTAARELVEAALEAGSTASADPASARLKTVRATAVTVRPSGDVLVRYTLELIRPDGSGAEETLVAATGALIPRGAAVLAGDFGDGEPLEVGLWRWPYDPALPGLARFSDHDGLDGLLREAGIASSQSSTVRLQGYRPAKRAVLAVTAGPHRLFAKVVPPAALAGLRTRHDLLAHHVPTPELSAATDDGVLLMPVLPGTSARTAIRRRQPLAEATALEALLDRLPATLTTLSGQSDHRRRAHHYAAVLGITALTDATDRAELAALTDAIVEADAGEQPVVAVHGDFYENQLLLDSAGTVTGLLDIDTAGRGHRLDDWATLLAHLTVLDTAGARAWARDILRHVELRFDLRHLRPRVASAVLGLATGPFRTQQADYLERTRRRVVLARQWLESR